MKHLIILFAALTFTIGCQKSELPKGEGQIATASIEVKTVKCDMCVETITKTLMHLDGVQNASVDLEKKVVAVQFAASKQTVVTLESAIAGAGYDANSVQRDEAAYKQLPECCQ
ncbi:MAG: heavy-metal-associated domain-containing protein [Ignavibacteriae bacterium]|nr:heavy-metal-associated domain-containing protein [Ignavibacteriota bacterium]